MRASGEDAEISTQPLATHMMAAAWDVCRAHDMDLTARRHRGDLISLPARRRDDPGAHAHHPPVVLRGAERRQLGAARCRRDV